jgi:hypothetical protein
MNIASVIKLYLRRLPEPLMTYDLYKECTGNGSFDVVSVYKYRAQRSYGQIRLNTKWDMLQEVDQNEAIRGLQDIVSRLPQQNYDTLKLLILHLKRVTW